MKVYHKHIGSEVIFLRDVRREKDNYNFSKESKGVIIDISRGYTTMVTVKSPEGEEIDIADYYICDKHKQPICNYDLVQITVDVSIPKNTDTYRLVERFNTKITQLKKIHPKDMLDYAERRGEIKAYEQAIKIVCKKI
jgi:hypothetical protein